MAKEPIPAKPVAKPKTPRATAKPAVKPVAKKVAKPKVKTVATPRKPRVVKPKPIPTETTFRDHANVIADQAKDKARGAAKQGLNITGDVLDNFAAAFADSAKSLEKRFGKEYGNYARKAADTVSGAAASVKESEVDDLLESARSFVKNKPLIAAGVAAAAGFALMRLFRAGNDRQDD